MSEIASNPAVDLGPLPDIYVGIKREYLIKSFGDNNTTPAPTSVAPDTTTTSESTNSDAQAAPNLSSATDSAKLAATTGNSNENWNHQKMTKKNKRKFNELKMKEDRLCSGFIINNVCPFGDKCRYNHDISGYLERKEKDLVSYSTSYCPNFHAFGYCSYGLMCRFGGEHIDKNTHQNICRSAEDGGVIPGKVMNTLDKHVQVQLRKKCYGKAPKKPFKPAADVFPVPAPASAMAVDSATTDAASADTPAPTGDASASSSTATDTATATATATEGEATTPAVTALNTQDDYTAARLKNNPVASHNFYRSNVADNDDKTKKLVDFSTKKVYVAPLTTVGNLPFRRILKHYGADVTCGEMAMINNLEAGQSSEWALLRRHEEEDCFGIQLAGSRPDEMKRVCSILEKETTSNFIDLNCGCPIDVLCDRGCGAALMNRPGKIVECMNAMTGALSRSVTIKLRIGWDEKAPNIQKIIPMLQASSKGKVAAFFVHGRSRLQRYSRLAHWNIVTDTAVAQHDEWMKQFYSSSADTPIYPLVPIVGNGDIMSWEDWKGHQAIMDLPENWIEPDAAEVERLDAFVKSTATKEKEEAREMVVAEMRAKGLLCNTAMVSFFLSVCDSGAFTV